MAFDRFDAQISFANTGAYSHSPHSSEHLTKDWASRPAGGRTISQGLERLSAVGTISQTLVGDSQASSRMGVTPNGTSSCLNNSVDISRIGTLSGRHFCAQIAFRASSGSYEWSMSIQVSESKCVNLSKSV